MQRSVELAQILVFAIAFLTLGCGGGDSADKSGSGTSVKSGSKDSSVKQDIINKLKPDPSSLKTSKTESSASPKETPKTTATKPKTTATRPEPESVEPAPSEAELRAALPKMIANFVASLSTGDEEKAGVFLTSKAQFEKLLRPGTFRILGSTLPAQNKSEVKLLIELAKGQEVSHELEAGQLSTGAKTSAAFRVAAPMVTKAALTLTIQGHPVPYRIELDQIVWVDGGWRFFNIKH